MKHRIDPTKDPKTPRIARNRHL